MWHILIIPTIHSLALLGLGCHWQWKYVIVLSVGYGIIIYLTKHRLKEFPVYFKKLPFQESGLLLVIQLIFLIIVLQTGNFLAWFGVLFCEFIRIRLFPKRLLELEKITKFKSEITGMNEQFRVVRAQRHDFLRHINVLDHILSESKNEKAKEYLRDLVEDYQAVNLSVKGEEGHISATLIRTQQQAYNAGIDVHYDFEVPLSALPMSNLNQVKLISNLLDNAFDAALEYKQSNENATITVKIDLRSGIYLLEVSNSAQFPDPVILDSLFKKFNFTTKDGHEGLGTYIIHSLVQSHHGKLTFSYNKPIFTVKIKLPIVIEKSEEKA